jgi:hypothetical protein
MTDARQFTSPFPEVVREGDSIITLPDADGIYYLARIVRDEDAGAPDEMQDGFWPSADPDDAGYVAPEHYDEEQAHATAVYDGWVNDEWFYCGIILSKHLSDERFEEDPVFNSHVDSLWGIEANYPKENANACLMDYAHDLLATALAEGRA